MDKKCLVYLLTYIKFLCYIDHLKRQYNKKKLCLLSAKMLFGMNSQTFHTYSQLKKSWNWNLYIHARAIKIDRFQLSPKIYLK